MGCNYALFVAFSVILLLSIDFVGAVGLSSSSLKTVIDFEPNLERTFSYVVLTNAGRPMDYIIAVKGGYSQYFHLSTERFVMVPSGESKAFTLELKLPEKFDAPGLHDHLICALEGEGRGGGGIGTRVEVCASVAIRVLYDYKYLLINSFVAPNGDRGDNLPLQLTVKSWTKQDISNVNAIIDIFKPDETGNFTKKVTTIYTDQKSLPSNAEETLTAYLATKDLEPGNYKAIAKVFYDGNEVNESATFKIGLLTVKVLNYTRIFERGKVEKFDVEIASRWNTGVEKIYAVINIQNDTLKTPYAYLDAWQSVNLTAYWDLTAKKVGDYSGKIILYYGDNSSETDIKVKVVVGSGEIRGILISVVVSIIVVVLIVLLVVLTLKTRNAKNEKEEVKKNSKKKSG